MRKKISVIPKPQPGEIWLNYLLFSAIFVISFVKWLENAIAQMKQTEEPIVLTLNDKAESLPI